MALWMVRPGKYGEREQSNLERSVVSIGWEGLPDLSGVTDRTQLSALMSARYTEEKPSTLSNWVRQVWTFAKSMRIGDLIAMPLKSSPAIQFGKIAGDYAFNAEQSGAQHYRQVEWLHAVPRSALDADLRYSFGAIMTVCEVKRNDAETRITALLSETTLPVSAVLESAHASFATSDDATDTVNFEELARDMIRTHISRKFDGHGLAELVEAVLQTQGYKTFRSPPGPDGGVDVLAGLGPQGLNGPSLAVQVKSGLIEVDTNTLRLFKTAMNEFHADQGLIVSWGGFKQTVQREVAREFFKIRMWGQDDFIDAILSNYEALPPAIQARLPLKRMWMLVLDE